MNKIFNILEIGILKLCTLNKLPLKKELQLHDFLRRNIIHANFK